MSGALSLRQRRCIPKRFTQGALRDPGLCCISPLDYLDRLFLFLILIALTITAQAESLSSEQNEFFESRVRPILVDHCYECHSTDADEIEAGLVLDSKQGWMNGGDSGAAIVPGNLDASLLVQAIRYEEDVVSGMPPRSKLPEEKLAILEEWVAMGAPDPRTDAKTASPINEFDLRSRVAEHWSWRPIVSPQIPSTENTKWSDAPIDRFVLEKLEQVGLKPALEADRRTWLRRVYLDVIGLPPSVDQIERFLADDTPDADQKVVTALLDSPHYGEKWARHWMDLVRYSETYGHEFDYPIHHAHEYRDYLIRAMNADVPYDQFIREQVAGDLLAEPRRHPTEDFNESIIGTGFWYFHDATHAPTDVLNNEADIIANQLDVFSKSFLGLTVACARCHDHKFDAISAADYYALSAYIQSSCRQFAPLDPGRRIEAISDQIEPYRAQADQELRTVDTNAQEQHAPSAYHDAAMKLQARLGAEKETQDFKPEWIEQAAEEGMLDRDRLDRWVSKIEGIGGSFEKTWDNAGSDLLEGFDDRRMPSEWTTSGTAFQAVSDQLLTADGGVLKSGTVSSRVLGRKQHGILRSPTFEITANNIHVRMKATPNMRMLVVMDNYQMTITNALLFKGTLLRGKETDTNGQWVWKSLDRDLRKYVGHLAYLEFVDDNDGFIEIDEIRFSNSPAPSQRIVEDGAKSLDERWIRGIENLRNGTMDPLIGWLIENELVSIVQLSAKAGASISEATKLADQLPAPRYVLAMAQGTEEDSHIYVRGNSGNLGQKVPPRFLEAIDSTAASRLEMAEKVASPDNPLTARVIVNRLWHHLFGRGIVPSVDDFGPQGQPPSHPELLDWLASDLISNDWSLKQTIRQIVLSQTYRQQSVANPEVDSDRIVTVDPTNALLHKMPVRRLSSESIRDSILAVSGQLDTTQFGRSVPTHLTSFMTGRGRPGKSGPLDGDGRRSVYLALTRNFLNPFMMTFDMPSPFGPQGRRSRSNVPAQSLTLLNDPFVREQADKWADSVLAIPDLDDRQREALMMQQAHGVSPSSNQAMAMERFLSRQSELYGERDRRAWADLAHSLLNMKAFYYVR